LVFALVVVLVLTLVFALVLTLVFALVFAAAGALADAAALVTPAATFAGRLDAGVIEMGRVRVKREARVGRRTRLAREDATRCNIVKLKQKLSNYGSNTTVTVTYTKSHSSEFTR